MKKIIYNFASVMGFMMIMLTMFSFNTLGAHAMTSYKESNLFVTKEVAVIKDCTVWSYPSMESKYKIKDIPAGYKITINTEIIPGRQGKGIYYRTIKGGFIPCDCIDVADDAKFKATRKKEFTNPALLWVIDRLKQSCSYDIYMPDGTQISGRDDAVKAFYQFIDTCHLFEEAENAHFVCKEVDGFILGYARVEDVDDGAYTDIYMGLENYVDYEASGIVACISNEKTYQDICVHIVIGEEAYTFYGNFPW